MPWLRALVGVLAVVLAEPAAVAEKGARTRSGWVVDANRHLFDAQGRFLYRPRFAAPLALDNGDAPLRAIRINYPAHLDAAKMAHRRPLFEAALGDSLRVLERLPETELRIVAPSVGILEPYLAPVPRSLRRRIRVIPVEDTEDITPWARDPSLMLADGQTLLLPRDKVRAKRVEEEDAESEGELTPKAQRDYFGVVEKYARAQGLRLERSLFTFEGGNVLRGRHNVFVGASLLSEAMDDLDLGEDEAREALAGELGGRLHVVGTPARDRLGHADQPHQHIDMTMAIAADHRTGGEVALVESVSLARRLLPSARAPRTAAEATLQRLLWPVPTEPWARS
jgi:hypothetical protein